MKNLLLNHWKAKLVCLLLASVLWYLIKQNLERGPLPPTNWPVSPANQIG